MNPIYNGWIRRHRFSRNETRKPAPWRSGPPVSDELWAARRGRAPDHDTRWRAEARRSG